MLTLLCGLDDRARTDALTDAIRADVEAGRRCCLIVPEQQAYLSERHFAAALPPSAGRYFEILSFSRLADGFFRRFGGPEPSAVGSAAQTLLMWDTLRRVAPNLHCFGRSERRDSTLTEKLLAAVAELESNGVTEEALGAALPSVTDPTLRDKLGDLIEISTAFRARRREVAGQDPSERLSLLASKLRGSDRLADVRFYLDSFTGFTAPEYEVLTELMRGDRCLTVSLCLDRTYSRAPQLAAVAETAARLVRTAKKVGCAVRETVLPQETDARPASLARLGETIWDLSAPAAVEPYTDGAVELLLASNRYEEAEACADRILALVGEGYRFGEIAVLVRDPDSVRGILDAALIERGIPCFLSERVELAAKPLARLLLSAVRAVTRGFRSADIITLVKTGLCGADLRDVALFEEYCETWHIEGRRFLAETWEMNPDGLTDRRSERAEEILAAANRVRETVIPPLCALRDAMKAAERLGDRCRAVYAYLCDLHISDRLADAAQRELALGQVKEAGETLRLYRFLTDSLGEMTELLPDATPNDEEFLSMLSLFLADADLGSVPNRHDCVLIGSAATARFPSVRAVLVVGVCETEFPRRVSDDGILTERDKAALDPLGVRFEVREARQNAEELFYVWRAFHLPTERLCLLCPLRETDGQELTPSLAFTRTERLLGIKPKTYRPARQVGLTVGGALHARPLPAGTELRLSDSSISDFVKCPYRYYISRTLHLREGKTSDLQTSNDGTFLHYLFEALLRGAIGRDGSFRLPEQQELEGLTERIAGDYLTRICPIPPDRMDARVLHLFSRLQRLGLRMLRGITEELRAGQFIPAQLEQRIGGSGANSLPAVSFPLSRGRVALSGKIDRIDLWRDGDREVVRVVDYKSSKTTFDPEKVRTGERLQLILYLTAALAADPRRVPGGAEYLYYNKGEKGSPIAHSGLLLDDGAVREAMVGTAEKSYLDQFKKNTYTEQEIRGLMGEMREAVCSVAERILGGEADKTPGEENCRFCPILDRCDRADRASKKNKR